MRTLSLALAVGLIVLGNGSAFAQNTKATLEDHENRITDLEGDVQALDGRVTALEGNGNGQGGPLVFDSFSAAMVLGNVGVTGLTDACGAARVCTTKEFMLSLNIDMPVGAAWILPTMVAGTSTQCVEFSGLQASCSLFSCSGWTNIGTASTGMVVTGAGGIATAACNGPGPRRRLAGPPQTASSSHEPTFAVQPTTPICGT